MAKSAATSDDGALEGRVQMASASLSASGDTETGALTLVISGDADLYHRLRGLSLPPGTRVRVTIETLEGG